MDVIEKMARTICETHGGNPDRFIGLSVGKSSDGISYAVYEWMSHIQAAQAALAVLSDPGNISDEMCDAAYFAYFDGDELNELSANAVYAPEYREHFRRAFATMVSRGKSNRGGVR